MTKKITIFLRQWGARKII